jgi:hypothetical protein
MTDSADIQVPEQNDFLELDTSDQALHKLKEYVSNFLDGIILAGPPTLKGSLANFYKEYPTESAVIKALEHEDNKMGIHSFVRKHNDVFTFNGKGAKKHVVLFANTSRPKTPRLREPMVAQSRQIREPEVAKSRQTEINEIRGTIRSIEVLLKELTEQTDKLSI